MREVILMGLVGVGGERSVLAVLMAMFELMRFAGGTPELLYPEWTP